MDETVVKIEEGEIQGKLVTGWKGTSFYSFQGIPYARPPLGHLRFKAPQPPEKWMGIKDCTKEGSACYSRHMFFQNLLGSEDCLNLNVYTKELPKQSNVKLKPVMVWIHGGAFISGSSKTDLHGPDYLVNEDVVIITINYRLGLLGFFSLEDPSLEVPGNCGFKDQVMALEWVQRNVTYFGGNPKNVTIFGVSAGAASVHYLILSPMAKGLFHKAILQSASALCPWSVTNSPSKTLMRLTGCSTEGNLLKKLQELPVEKLYELQEKMGDSFVAWKVREIGLVIENPTKQQPNFMLESPLEILRKGTYSQIPMIIGYCTREGMFYASLEKKQNKSLLITDFEDAIPNQLHIPRGTNKSKNVAKKIKEFYYGNEEPSEKNKDKFFLMQSDIFFLRGIYRAMRYHAIQANPPVYFYRFSLETRLNIYKKVTGVTLPGTSHADDIAYLFKTDLTPENIGENDVEALAIKRVTKMWTAFAKTGNPNPKPEENIDVNVIWERVRQNCINFIDIGEVVSVGINPEADRMTFWDDVEKISIYAM